MKSISDLIIKLPQNEFEEAMKDLEVNENDFEQKEEASNLKRAFHLSLLSIALTLLELGKRRKNFMIL